MSGLDDVTKGVGELTGNLTKAVGVIGLVESAYEGLKGALDIGHIRQIEKGWADLTRGAAATNVEIKALRESVERLGEKTSYYSKAQLSDMIVKLREGTSALALFRTQHEELAQKFAGAYRQDAEKYLATLGKLSDQIPQFATAMAKGSKDLGTMMEIFRASGPAGISTYNTAIRSASETTDRSSKNINDKINEMSKTWENFKTKLGGEVTGSFSNSPASTIGALVGFGMVLNGGVKALKGGGSNTAGLGGLNSSTAGVVNITAAQVNVNGGGLGGGIPSSGGGLGGPSPGEFGGSPLSWSGRVSQAAPYLIKGGAALAAGNILSQYQSNKNPYVAVGADVGTTAAYGYGGASVGAGIGSIFPGIGTAIGATVGGALGVGYGVFTSLEGTHNRDAALRGSALADKLAKEEREEMKADMARRQKFEKDMQDRLSKNPNKMGSAKGLMYEADVLKEKSDEKQKESEDNEKLMSAAKKRFEDSQAAVARLSGGSNRSARIKAQQERQKAGQELDKLNKLINENDSDRVNLAIQAENSILSSGRVAESDLSLAQSGQQRDIFGAMPGQKFTGSNLLNQNQATISILQQQLTKVNPKNKAQINAIKSRINELQTSGQREGLIANQEKELVGTSRGIESLQAGKAFELQAGTIGGANTKNEELAAQYRELERISLKEAEILRINHDEAGALEKRTQSLKEGTQARAEELEKARRIYEVTRTILNTTQQLRGMTTMGLGLEGKQQNLLENLGVTKGLLSKETDPIKRLQLEQQIRGIEGEQKLNTTELQLKPGQVQEQYLRGIGGLLGGMGGGNFNAQMNLEADRVRLTNLQLELSKLPKRGELGYSETNTQQKQNEVNLARIQAQAVGPGQVALAQMGQLGGVLGGGPIVQHIMAKETLKIMQDVFKETQANMKKPERDQFQYAIKLQEIEANVVTKNEVAMNRVKLSTEVFGGGSASQLAIDKMQLENDEKRLAAQKGLNAEADRELQYAISLERVKVNINDKYAVEQQHIANVTDVLEKQASIYAKFGAPIQASKLAGQEITYIQEAVASAKRQYQEVAAQPMSMFPGGKDQREKTLTDLSMKILGFQDKIADLYNVQRRTLGEQFAANQINLAGGTYINPGNVSEFALMGSGYKTGVSQRGDRNVPMTWQTQMAARFGPGIDERSNAEQSIQALIGGMKEEADNALRVVIVGGVQPPAVGPDARN